MKLSVLMCFYHGESSANLEEALLSVINQSTPADEIVLVQDGPVSKELLAVVSAIMKQTDYIKLLVLETNSGHGIARNVGLKACQNELVAIVDSDDVCRQDRFEKQLVIFSEHPEIAVVSSNLAEFSGSINNIVSHKVLPSSDSELKSLMRWKCPINQPSVMFNKAAVEAVGGYIDWFNNEDYYLWIRMAAAGFGFKNITESLVYFRVSADVYDRRGGWKYFISEYGIQKIMLKKGIGTYKSFLFGVCVRFIIQVLVPNSIRAFIYKTFLRKKMAVE